MGRHFCCLENKQQSCQHINVICLYMVKHESMRANVYDLFFNISHYHLSFVVSRPS